MLSGRRFRTYAESGELSEDFEGLEVVHTEKRVPAKDKVEPLYRDRITKMEAIDLLRKAGWSSEKIAVAVSMSARHVRRKKSTIRAYAEACGRV